VFAVLANTVLAAPSADHRTTSAPSLNDSLAQLGLTIAPRSEPGVKEVPATKAHIIPTVIMDYIAAGDCPECPIIKIQSLTVCSMMDDSLKSTIQNTQVTFVPFSDGPRISSFLLRLAEGPENAGSVCHLGDIAPANAFTIPFCNPDGTEQYFVCLHRSLLNDEHALMSAINCQLERVKLWQQGQTFSSPEAAMAVAHALSEQSLAQIEKNIVDALPQEPDLGLLLKILRSRPNSADSTQAEHPHRHP